MATKKRIKKDISIEPEVHKEILTNARLEELKKEFEDMYNNPAFSKVLVCSAVDALTERILSGELVVEKA